MPRWSSRRRSGAWVASENGVRRDGDLLGGEADGLVELDAGDVGLGAEVGVADDVEVGEAAEAEGLRDAAAAGGLDIEDGVGVGPGGVEELVAKVESAEE